MVQQGDPCARTRCIAGRADLLKLAIWNHAQHHRVFDIDMAAKGTGQADPINLVDAHAFHQQTNPGIESRLTELNGPDIVLHHLESRCTGRRPVQLVGKGTTVCLDAWIAHGKVAADGAVMANDAGQIHFCQHLDDAGAAHAGHP